MASSLLELVFAPPSRDEPGGRATSGRVAGEISHAASSDSALFGRLAAGDVAAFDQIVLDYDRPLRQFARRMVHDTDVADDVVQDVFLWLWDHRGELARVTGTLRGYLYGAVRNRALGVLRRMRTEEACVVRIDPGFEIPGMGGPEPGTAAGAERAELAVALAAALNALPPRTRQVALLRWRDRLSRAEVAAIMGVAVPTVNNQLTQAARVVRALLTAYLPDSE